MVPFKMVRIHWFVYIGSYKLEVYTKEIDTFTITIIWVDINAYEGVILFVWGSGTTQVDEYEWGREIVLVFDLWILVIQYLVIGGTES